MKKKLLAGLASGVFMLGMLGMANAAVITFEGQANTEYYAPITRLGFDIGNVVGQEQHFHEVTSTLYSLPNNGTGVLLNDRDTQIFVEANGGATFTLTSVDVASATGNNPAVGLTIEGFNNSISTGLITLTTLGTGYTTLFGNALGLVDTIIFDGIGGAGGFVLDNLALNERAVPVPATLLLFGTGLAGLAGSRIRRTKKA